MAGFDSEDVEEMEKHRQEWELEMVEIRKKEDRQRREIEYHERAFKVYDDAYDDVDNILESNYNGEINDAKALELIHEVQTETYQALGNLREHFFPEDFENIED